MISGNVILDPGFADNDRLIVSVGNNILIPMVWEAFPKRLLTPHREQGTIVGIGFRDGGREIITSGPGTKLIRWEAGTSKPVGSITIEAKLSPGAPPGLVVNQSSIGPDAVRALIYPIRGYQERTGVYDAVTGTELLAFPSNPKDSNTEYFTSAHMSRLVRLSAPSNPKATTAACEVWDVSTGKKTKEFVLTSVTESGDRLIAP